MRKNIYRYIPFLGILAIVSCEPEFDNPLEDNPITAESGEADFSTYVAVGASITAGFADGALFAEGQEVAFTKLIATQMEAAGGGAFTTPSMADNIGGFAGLEAQFPTRLIIDAVTEAPIRANDNIATNDISALIPGLYNNLGVPGAKSFHAPFSGYAAANPYFGRMATTPEATMIGDAVAQDPTFFSLWLGGNDVLGYATSGGTGIDQFAAGNDDPASYEPEDITSANVFAGSVLSSVTDLTANGAAGILINVPALSDLPFFTTVPHNPIPMDEATATNTNMAYNAYNMGLLQAQAAIDSGMVPGVPVGFLSNDEIARRSISFSAGQNAVVILDESLTDLTLINPALTNLRQATAEDLLVLTSSSFIGTLADSTNPASVNGVAIPLGDEWVLTPEEQLAIETATATYNQTLEAIASNFSNVMVFDANSLLSELSSTGLSFDGGTVFAVLGSAFSLDGIHLSPRGNAVFANRIIDEINDIYGATLEQTIPLNFSTITLSEFEPTE